MMPKMMPKMRRAILIVTTLMMVASAAAADQQFLSGFAAMPLMNGFEENADELVFFNGDQGAIVESTAYGEPPPIAVMDYYRTLLPQLGWRHQGGKWQRGNTALSVTAERLGDETAVTFRLTEGGIR